MGRKILKLFPLREAGFFGILFPIVGGAIFGIFYPKSRHEDILRFMECGS